MITSNITNSFLLMPSRTFLCKMEGKSLFLEKQVFCCEVFEPQGSLDTRGLESEQPL